MGIMLKKCWFFCCKLFWVIALAISNFSALEYLWVYDEKKSIVGGVAQAGYNGMGKAAGVGSAGVVGNVAARSVGRTGEAKTLGILFGLCAGLRKDTRCGS